ncbi:MAG: septum site-determining protein MinC [Burkholderiaceae bacterium]|nr:septum site-determining protein MinC [Burkholderiaceae bacterium]
MPVITAAQPANHAPESFKIKSAHLQLVALMIKTADWDVLTADLSAKFGAQGESPDFFDHDALVLDFSQLDADLPVQDLTPLLAVLRSCRLVPVAMRGANAAWTASARAFGLVEAPIDAPRLSPVASVPTLTEIAEPEVVYKEVFHEVIREVVHEVAGPTTLVIDKPLRSGQKIYARGGDLVVLAMVNQGAEVVADGNIHVYAPLRGKAMAGASGNVHARIFSTCLEPELISIAGIYRTSENPLAADVRGKAAQVRLSNDGQDKLLIEALRT